MQLPGVNSNSQSWIEWHKYLKSNLRQKEANTYFMQHWASVGQNSDTANDNVIRSYAKSEGMEITGNYGPLSGISDTWQSANTGFKKIGSTAMIGVVLIILMLVAAVYFLFIKKD